MTDRKELEALIAKAQAAGALVAVKRDAGDYPVTITIYGLKGVGPQPMSSINCAERLREVMHVS